MANHHHRSESPRLEAPATRALIAVPPRRRLLVPNSAGTVNSLAVGVRESQPRRHGHGASLSVRYAIRKSFQELFWKL